MMEMVNADVDISDVDQVISTMMQEHGFGDKEELTLKDFQTLMNQYSSELSDASLDIPGKHILMESP